MLRQMGYEETQIYVMHFHHTFQYLFSWKNEIFMQHVVIMPFLWRRIANKIMGLPLYTLANLEGAEDSMLSTAMDSIDLLKKLKEKKAKILKSDRKCMWRSRISQGNEPLYECLLHDKTVPHVEGELPSHTKKK